MAMSESRFDKPYTQLIDDGDVIFVITNTAFGSPLYAWYVFPIEQFNPGDIESVLQTPPISIEGPFMTLRDAQTAVLLSCISNPNFDLVDP